MTVAQVCYGKNDINSASQINNALAGKVISKLGIQSVPGTYFYLNGNGRPIVLGSLGTYEFDFNGDINITSIIFTEAGLSNVTNSGGYLIIDYVYEG